MINDLREYIECLTREGQVQPIDAEVDWDLEVGAIIRRSYDLSAPAPLFRNIKGYPPGYRIFGAPVGLSSRPKREYARIAISLGLPPESTVAEITEAYAALRRRETIKPRIVSDGPCKENVRLGEKADLLEFPAPLLHEGDGGRYIGTWHAFITKDPDTGWSNWGMYRLMVHDARSMGILLSPNQHVGLHFYGSYEPRGKPMEFAVAMGTEPVTPLIAATRVFAGVDEADVISTLRGEPLELVKCETVDLLVPATSEIVIEGEIRPNERREEGPFGEYTGYRAGDRAPRPVCHVRAITHRNDPILPVTCMGVPVDDNDVVMPITKSGEMLNDLRSRGFPIKMVCCPPEAVTHMAVVSTKVPFPGYARHLAHAIWGAPGPGRSTWFLVIHEDDIDVTDMKQVIWGLTTRCHPDRGIWKVTDVPAMPLLPFLSQEERSGIIGAHTLLDCTWPKDWPADAVPVKASLDVMWPAEIRDKVLSKWTEYGYEEA